MTKKHKDEDQAPPTVMGTGTFSGVATTVVEGDTRTEAVGKKGDK